MVMWMKMIKPLSGADCLSISAASIVNFSYKNFSLNVFFQWSYGNDIYNANRMMFEGNTSGKNSLNQYENYIDRWTMDNQSSTMFRAGG